MTFLEALPYVMGGKPMSKALLPSSLLITRISNLTCGVASQTCGNFAAATMGPEVVTLSALLGHYYNFIRLGGLSGASAVILGAIGSHSQKLKKQEGKEDLKAVFETANRFHFFHSLMLLAVPLVKYPLVTGTLVATGTLLFSGTLYHIAFTSDRRFAHLAPIGGTILIFSWLSLLL